MNDTRRLIAGAYIISAQHSNMERQKLHWNNSEDALETVHCVRDFEHFVCELLRFQVPLVANENGTALQTRNPNDTGHSRLATPPSVRPTDDRSVSGRSRSRPPELRQTNKVVPRVCRSALRGLCTCACVSRTYDSFYMFQSIRNSHRNE